MFMNSYISGELARERRREMLVQAGHQRLVRRLRAESRTAQSDGGSKQRLRSALRAAAGAIGVAVTAP